MRELSILKKTKGVSFPIIFQIFVEVINKLIIEPTPFPF